MKIIISLLTGLFLALPTNADEPVFNITGNLRVGEEANSLNTIQYGPSTFNLDVPVETAEGVCGFDISFAVTWSRQNESNKLDSIQITNCQYSIFHTNTATGIETPVILVDGNTATNINVPTFKDETSSGPVVFTVSNSWEDPKYNPEITSATGLPITTPASNVYGLLMTKQKFVWGSSPDFFKPTLGQGYTVRWKISFIPTYKGVQYTEQTIDGDYLKFNYKVAEVPLPKLVSISSDEPNGGIILQMSGDQLEFFELQRSTDMENWTSWPYTGEGDYWLDVKTYQWTLFDRAFPNEPRRAPKEFFRMVWAGRNVRRF